jgi:hypothetical protein
MRRLQHRAYPFRHLKYEASPVVALDLPRFRAANARSTYSNG